MKTNDGIYNDCSNAEFLEMPKIRETKSPIINDLAYRLFHCIKANQELRDLLAIERNHPVAPIICPTCEAPIANKKEEDDD